MALVLVVAILLVAGCKKDLCKNITCASNQVCREGVCVCGEGYKKCLNFCIANEECCSDSECELPKSCVEGVCIDLCEGVRCAENEACYIGDCVCLEGFRKCYEDSPCIGNTSCCTDSDCGDERLCINNTCTLPCSTMKCGPNEECRDGKCSCKKGYFKAKDGACIPVGMCRDDRDCNSDEKCEDLSCVRDCFKLKIEGLVSDCFWEEAISKKDETLCSLVEGDDRTRCYFNVSVEKKDRTICDVYVPLTPKLALSFFNKQECVVQVAERLRDYEECQNVPKFSFKETEDPDEYCKRRVFEYIEYMDTDTLDECNNDCGCLYRFVTKKLDISSCKHVCKQNLTQCMDFFYEG